jgi:hypothetical protein
VPNALRVWMCWHIISRALHAQTKTREQRKRVSETQKISLRSETTPGSPLGNTDRAHAVVDAARTQTPCTHPSNAPKRSRTRMRQQLRNDTQSGQSSACARTLSDFEAAPFAEQHVRDGHLDVAEHNLTERQRTPNSEARE